MSDPIEPKEEEKQENPEEQKAESEALEEVKEDELREKLADDMGLDPDTDKDLLDRLVDREKSHREKLSSAIKQKRTWREKAQASIKPKNTTEAGKTQSGQENLSVDEIVERKLTERLEARELEGLGYSETISGEIKDLAKLKGISPSKAAQHPYIKGLIEDEEREKKVLEATPKRSGRGSYSSNFDPSQPVDPSKFNMNSAEGVKAYRDARAARNEYLRNKS